MKLISGTDYRKQQENRATSILGSARSNSQLHPTLDLHARKYNRHSQSSDSIVGSRQESQATTARQSGSMQDSSEKQRKSKIGQMLNQVKRAASRIVPSFPGAEGFGARAKGGRGGRVIEVTNLQDSGVGSLRAAIEAEGRRTVVFRVGGTIRVNSSLEIEDPYITIAGQTAPGGGITLRNSQQNIKAPLVIKTHDVVMRYVRLRPGSNPNEDGNLDALTIAGAPKQVYNIMIDHCSLSWATDEVMSTFYDVRNLTIQWSIIAEGLDCSTHREGGQRQCHSMGLLLGSQGSERITVHHNLLAHNRRRNPLVENTGITDIVNNVIYNPGSGEDGFPPSQVIGTYGRTRVNYVGNYFKPGVDTGNADWWIDSKDGPVSIFAQNNRVPKALVQSNTRPSLVNRPHPAPGVTITSAQRAYQQVLAKVGASQQVKPNGAIVFRRDAIDRRIINDVRNGTGRIIDDPKEVGGWTAIASGKPPRDTDRDGMPDVYENRYGLNRNNPLDGSRDADGDGYTNVEEFLNGTRVTD